MEPCRIRDHSKMKKFTFKGVLDGIRGSVSQQSKAETEIEETLRTEHFQVAKTVRHGFPYQPTAMAFDPVQRILAVGTKSGSLRILGRPGVDCHVRHEGDNAILQLLFLVNEGALVSVCSDDTLHLWNLRQKIPEIVHTLKFQRERITYCHLPFQSKWLYIGTERGNVHIVNIESFVLSGYVINWNKAIELSRKTHPGAVVHLSDNPVDSNKMLIGFESGTLVLWDLRNKAAELRYQNTETLRSVSWHHEGKQFMCSHGDGSLSTWNLRVPLKAATTYYPHGKINKEGKQEACKAISKLEWKSQRAGDTFVVFSGGLPHDRAGVAPSITVIHGKTTTVLEMEHSVIDFITLCESPWQSEPQEPYSIVVLLHNDLVVVDLTTTGYLCFENPYPMDLHESSVTCCMYLADCPADLIPALYSMGARANKRTGFSDKEWPIKGGAWGTNTCSYPEMIVTGHADGSLKFWDASALSLQILYKLKTAKIFEKPKARSLDGQQDEDPFAIQQIFLCPESRMLCVAGASSQVILFRFSKQESMAEIPALEIPIICEADDDVDYSPEYEYPPRPTLSGTSQQGSYAGSYDEKKVPSLDAQLPLKVKCGPQKRPPGYQASLVCLTHCVEGEPMGQITSLTLNSSYGLMAYGNEVGLVIIDICQKTCLLNIGSPDLYGSSDPYQRIPRSPKKNPGDIGSSDPIERCRSPTSDQSMDPFPSPPTSPRLLGTKFSLRKSISVDPTSFAHPDCVADPLAAEPSADTNNRRVSLLPSTRVQRSNTVPTEFQTSGNNVLLDHMIGLRETQFLSSSSSASSATGDTLLEEVLCEEASDSVFEPETVIKLRSKFKQSRSISWRGFGFTKRKVSAAAQNPAKPQHRHTVHCGDPKDPNSTNGPTTSNSDTVERARGWKRRMSVVDLRTESEEASPLSPVTTVMKRLIIGKDKMDTSFSRSRSSSMSSLENISNEAIQCLAFSDSYTRKSDTLTCPTLWVGTSLGSVLVIMLNSPPMGSDARQTQPVIVSPSGTIFRLKGAILALSFLDCNGSLLRYQYETWRDLNRLEPRDTKEKERASGNNQLLPGPPLKSPHNVTNRISPTAPTDMQAGDRQFAVIASEKQARVIALPSQTCAFKQQLSDASSFVVKADIIAMKDSVCLACYGANGHLSTFTLPSLRPLMDIEFLPLIDLSYQTSEQGTIDPMICIWGKQLIHSCETDLIARTFCFSNYGHGMFLCSPCEIQKFAISTEFCGNLTEMLGELFLACDTPEAPKESFFKNLFGGGPRALDREELFGEASGKASRSIARHIPGSVNIDNLNTRATGVVGDVSRARQALNERGEGLSQLEERTQRMLTEADVYHQNTHQLMLKYRDKKWYQF